MNKVQIQVKDRVTSKSFTIDGEDLDVHTVYHTIEYLFDELKKNDGEEVTISFPLSVRKEKIMPEALIRKVKKLYGSSKDFNKGIKLLMEELGND